MIRYTGDEMTVSGVALAWVFGWADLLRGFIRVISFGLLDSDLKLWLKTRLRF